MKKIVCLVLIFISVLLCGCGQRAENAPAPSTGTVAAYSRGYANMKVQLPAGWDFETVKPGLFDRGDAFGLRFWKEAEPETVFNLYFHPVGLGLCGTGVTFEKIYFRNGMTATKCTELSSFWLIYEDLPGTYAVTATLPEGWWTENGEELLEVLETAELAGGILPLKTAEEKAKTTCTVSYDKTEGLFDYESGGWVIRFYRKDSGRAEQAVFVDRQGCAETLQET